MHNNHVIDFACHILRCRDSRSYPLEYKTHYSNSYDYYNTLQNRECDAQRDACAAERGELLDESAQYLMLSNTPASLAELQRREDWFLQGKESLTYKLN